MKLQRKLQQSFRGSAQPLIAVLIGILTGALAISMIGESVLNTYKVMWNGAFGSFYFVTATFARATPIIFIGVGLALAFRAGVFNMGAEGQMVLGAIAAALAALYIPGPGILKIISALVAGILAGGLWALLAAWMEAKFKVQLLISTLLLNYVAVLFAGYLVAEPFQDKTGSAALAQTPMVDQAAWLPKLFPGMSLHFGFILAIVCAAILYFILKYTSAGYEVRMLGYNPFFAEYGGINKTKVLFFSMFFSGGIAGLAGTAEVLGSQYRYVEGALTVPGYAWTGLMAALLANSNPLGTAIAAILLAALQTGAMGMERNTEVPLEIASVIQGVLILFISAKFAFNWWNLRKKAGAANGSV
jgi:general nucleoside transport system permease protein